MGLARGQARLLPLLLFGVAFALSSVGPGAIIAVALLIPMAMAAATRAGVPRFLTALVVANGANAGNLSPISAIGIVANAKMAEVGLGGHEAKVWIANFVAHLLVMAVAYLVFGGWRLPSGRPTPAATPRRGFEPRHWLTVAMIARGSPACRLSAERRPAAFLAARSWC